MNIPVSELEQRVSELPEDKSAPIVCYCMRGARASNAVRILQSQGYTNVLNGQNSERMGQAGGR